MSRFEQQYTLLRKAEGRMYTDGQVRLLPYIQDHPLAGEWRSREQSARRLLRYLEGKARPLRILDAGSGNGWLAARMAMTDGCHVTGIEPNLSECLQAQRVFDHPRLRFIHGRFDEMPGAPDYDMIVFAASFQYFSPAGEVLDKAFRMLVPGGEVHILDTHFYQPVETIRARQRSQRYFAEAGFPELAEYYFHHSLADLHGFRYRVMYDPHQLYNRVFNRDQPFYWLCITEKNK